MVVMIKIIALLVFVAASLAEKRDPGDENTSDLKQPKILFYRYFTPMKLARAATFIHHHHSVTPRLLTFLSAPKNFHRLMIVPLIPPKFASPNANLVIKMAVGLEKTFARPGLESDPSFVISDSKRYIGAVAFDPDSNNYKYHAPCVGVEGASGPTSMRRQDAFLPKPSQTYYPGRFEIQLSLSDRWGTCFVPLDGGFSREMIYQNKLNPNQGLFLEIYGDDAQEKEGIKYIEMTILKEN